jgi:hypothetical protein
VAPFLPLEKLAPSMAFFARLLRPLASGNGGMTVEISSGKNRICWDLASGRGHGPWIPPVPAALIAAKLASGTKFEPGARPAFDTFTLEEFADAVAHLEIETTTKFIKPSGN